MAAIAKQEAESAPVAVTANRKKTFLSIPQLIERWSDQVSVQTLCNWRNMPGGYIGPRFMKLGGKILYPLEDVEAYEVERMAKRAEKKKAA